MTRFATPDRPLTVTTPMSDGAAAPGGPSADCALCPRLAGFRRDNQAAFPDWHNAPVPAWGGADAALLIVGLAPGLRGANRTGRPFTGDGAGDVLYDALLRHGWARGTYGARPDDGLELIDCRISNAVRCVPPENRPIPAEISNCNRFLAAELAGLPALECVLALGQIAHRAVLRALDLRQAPHPFAHGAVHALPNGWRLHDTYHFSRYNMNTGRLTSEMIDAVFAAITLRAGSSAPGERRSVDDAPGPVRL